MALDPKTAYFVHAADPPSDCTCMPQALQELPQTKQGVGWVGCHKNSSPHPADTGATLSEGGFDGLPNGCADAHGALLVYRKRGPLVTAESYVPSAVRRHERFE